MPGPGIVGRADERARLRALLDTGGALLVGGDAGVGKTMLLDELARVARDRGVRVVRAAGVEAETGIPYAALHQLVHTFLPLTHRLDPAQRAVLDGAFRGTGDAPSVMALGIAVLDLLALASAERALLLIADDGQWFDAPSVQVLTFVARRLGEQGISVAVGVREREPFGALVELPAAIGDDADLTAMTHLPLPRRLERVFAARIRQLPDGERADLLRAALDGHRPVGGHQPRAGAVGLLDVDPATGRIGFRHPLVRSAVVQLASPNERRAAHADLAARYPHDLHRRAGHLAAATVDPDPVVADTLERAAQAATRRGGAATAVGWLTRAAELSDRPADRARRLGDAAFIAGQAGLLTRAETLSRAAGEVATPAAVLSAGYVGLYRDGDVSLHRSVAQTLRAHAATAGDDTVDWLVTLLLAIAQFATDPVLWAQTDELVDELAGRLPATTLLFRDTWGDIVRRGAGVAERLHRAAATLDDNPPWHVMRLGVCAYRVDALADFRPYLSRIVDRERDAGAITNMMTMMHLTMLDHTASGRWDEAVRIGERGIGLAAEHGYELFGHQFRVFLGLVAAQRGELARATELQATVDRWARPRRVGQLVGYAESIGDYETAWAYATGLATPGEFAPYAQQAPRTLLDLVEAGLHTGRDGPARTHAEAARDARLDRISPRLALLTLGALAMTGPCDEAYAAVAAHPAAAAFPFERARIALAHGMWLRRQRRVVEARAVLTGAHDTFAALGATSWSERARHELASGVPARAELTTQERHIAELAATGLSNKQIGARLFLSPRTVGAHLYRIFPKLGITSRAALRDALD
ncbi:AAA family ATPase [Actinoplanes sp. NPDC051494]|uniref:helix-turn-helix transcriptional regulator n=1 Tax=Actinoplanes sp. NPDC051494 TaxID=3363907 RepID=UPI0037B52562